MNNADKPVIELLIRDNTIPSSGVFEVTDSMIEAFFNAYKEVYSSENKKLRPNAIRFAKKLAGLSLMKINLSRSIQDYEDYVSKSKTIKPKCGILYLISNPAFPGIYKIGITQNLEKRLAQYQTGDPYRLYKVEHYKFVDDMRVAEKEILDTLKLNIVKGEWVKTEEVKKLFISA